MDRSALLHQLTEAEWNVFRGAWRLELQRNAVQRFRPLLRARGAAVLKYLERKQLLAVRKAIQLRSQFKLLLEVPPHKN